MTVDATRTRAARGLRTAGRVVVAIVSAIATGALLGKTLDRVSGNQMAPWIIGRAAGVCAYLLLVALVLLGLALSHPLRSVVRRPSSAARIRAHIGLAVFTLGFTAVHVVVLATDRYANVGWWGAVVPMGSGYRPAAVTLGIVGLWVGLLIGLSAAAAGRLPRRLWWPVHKVAASSLVLIWLHGVFAGGDTPALRWTYLVSAVVVVTVAASRYMSSSPAEALPDRSR